MNAATLIEQARAAGVSIQLVGGTVKATGATASVNLMLAQLREHKAALVDWLTTVPEAPPEPQAEPVSWRVLDAAYLSHHFNCTTCQAAGHGVNYGLRCGVGMALWRDYERADIQPTSGGRDGNRQGRMT